MKTGRLLNAGVEKKNRAIAIGTRKDDHTVPIMSRLSEGSIAATKFRPAGGTKGFIDPTMGGEA